MATLSTLDTVENSQLDLSTTIYRAVRGGVVTGLVGTASTALEQIIDAVNAAIMPGGSAFGSRIIINGKALLLRRIVGGAVQGDTARVQLMYDNDLVGVNSAYVITFDGYLQAYQTNRLPGTRIPLLVPEFVDPDVDATLVIPADLATATFEYPMRQVTVSGIKQGVNPPPGQYDGWIGYANSDPFLNLPPGYWKITRGGTEISKYLGYYSYHLSAVTKNIEDWSQLFTLYNTKARIYVQPLEGDEDAVKTPSYTYGVIASAPGLLRVGPYLTTPMNVLFGLGQNIGLFDPSMPDSTGGQA